MKKELNLFFICIVILSCKQPAKNNSIKSNQKGKLRSIMVNKTQCSLDGRFKLFEVKDIVGTWKDSLFWKMQPNDSCYYGIDELDYSVKLKLNSNNTYKMTETSSVSNINNIEMGDFFLNNDSGVTTLTLANNPKGEVKFNHGDTIYNSVIYSLYWKDSTHILLEYPIKKGKYLLKEAIELKKGI